MFFSALITAFPMAVAWMILSNSVTWQSFIVGYIFGFAILLAIFTNTHYIGQPLSFRISRVPIQLFAIVRYITMLGWDIFRSGVDVAQRILRPQMNICPDIYRISTHSPKNDPKVAALSAHAITITPGSLVIDFEDNNGTMIIHTLDCRYWTEDALDKEQQERMQLIREILNND